MDSSQKEIFGNLILFSLNFSNVVINKYCTSIDELHKMIKKIRRFTRILHYYINWKKC